MRAVGTEAARAQARTYMSEWMVANQKWHPVSWRPDVLARRICNWLTHAEFVSAGADGDFAEKFLDNIARQVRHLRRAGRFVPNGVDRMSITKSLIYSALCLPNSIRFVPRQIKAVARMSEGQILPDGGHIERNPVSQMEALRHLIDIRSVLNTATIEIPEALQRAIDRAAPMLRFYRHGDGGFALFNGSTESEPWLIDVVLTKAKARGKPLTSATHTGFERVSAKPHAGDCRCRRAVAGRTWRACRRAELRDERRQTTRHRQLRRLCGTRCDVAAGPARDRRPFHAGGGRQELVRDSRRRHDRCERQT